MGKLEQAKLRAWVRELYKTKGPGTPFTLREMMEACGLDCERRRDHGRAHDFLIQSRKEFTDVMEMVFAPGGDFEKCKQQGLTDQQIFHNLVDTAISYQVYPVWADPYDEHKYKLFDMASYVDLMNRRAASIVKEMETKSHGLQLVGKHLPELLGMYVRPVLKNDGTLVQLPSAIECSLCHQHFDEQSSFVYHYNRFHASSSSDSSESSRGPPADPPPPRTCPLCKVPLCEMEAGDFKCPECKQKFDKDEMDK